ncbi:hypothetical protein SAMN02745135_01125 [Caloranaerobacter azorensis DSM 13643]|uniref:Uncharacterized protein n=1 Tax=Caloranaerobacter azorensis DSM 13643 TaxID=1121264 RepID=A0A1M5TTK4_9FIRM|nr:hypothetical protein [Caloranaerobacter azorensis]SHH54011.1 hypothetical protein SAMN02745135_01125 [Caloranaerobacter azorensis DSM 13643]
MNFKLSIAKKIIKQQKNIEKNGKYMRKEFEEEWNKWGTKSKEKIKFL